MNSAKFILVAAIVSLSGQAHAETADGNGALALAALVAENSPLLGATDKTVLAKFLNGQTNVTYPAGKTTFISVDKITCRASNVDIAYHSCDLVFGKKTRAHELYATLAEVGVQADGAAGSTFEAVSNLKCTIDANEVKQKSSGGAHYDYSPPN